MKKYEPDIFISKDKEIRTKTIKIYLPYQEYLSNYKYEFYNEDICTIEQCEISFKDYLIEFKYFDADLKAVVNFPLFQIKKRIKKSARNSFGQYTDVTRNKYFEIFINLEMPKLIKVDGINFTKSLFHTFSDHALIGYLYDLFFIANIACPGVLDFFRISFPSDVHPKIFFLGLPWFIARLNWEELGSIPIKILPVEKVFNWYKSILPDYDSLPNTAAANALISLIRFNSYDYEDPIDNLFLIHAIETLFGGNIPISLIKRRINSLFTKRIDYIKLDKIIESLYEWRHKFIHGGLKIPHPLASDISSEHKIKYKRPYELVNEVGFQLLLFSIQKLVKENAYEFRFAETLSFGKIER